MLTVDVVCAWCGAESEKPWHGDASTPTSTICVACLEERYPEED